MTHPLAHAAKSLAEAADALLACIPAAQSQTKPSLTTAVFNPFFKYSADIAAVQVAYPDWRTNVPNIREIIDATEDRDTAHIVRDLLVALADFEAAEAAPPASQHAIRNAAILRKVYGDRIPEDKSGRQIRNEMGWSYERYMPARAAYDRHEDLLAAQIDAD